MIRKRAEDDLYFLAEKILGYQDMHEPLHRRMCEWMDPRTWGVEEMRGMLIPRAHLKSSLCIALVIQTYLRDRDARIEYVHHVKTMAEQYNGEIMRQLETNRLLRQIAPDVFWADPKADSPLWLRDKFMVRVIQTDKVPSMTVAGIESESTGFHYNLVLLDDLVTGGNIGTEAARTKIEMYIRNKQAQLRPGGKILDVGTRWHPDDAHKRLMDSGVPFLVLGAYDDKGDPIFPRSKSGRAGHTHESLAERRSKMTEELFGLQYLNDAVLSSERRLKTEFIQLFDLPTATPEAMQELAGDVKFYTAVDLCNTQKATSDFAVVMTVGCVWTDLGRQLWIVDIDRGHFIGPRMVDLIRKHVDRWGPQRVFVESTGFQAQLKHWLNEDMIHEDRDYRLQMVSRPTNKSKDERIMSLAYLFEAEGVHLRKGLEVFKTEAQAFRPGTESKKDQLDCLEMIYTQVKGGPKRVRRVGATASAGTLSAEVRLRAEMVRTPTFDEVSGVAWTAPGFRVG